MSTPETLIEELERTLASGTNEQRIQALARITDLFVASAGRYSEDQIGLFDDVILRIAARIEAKTLAKLSNRLAAIPHAPAKVMKQLAFHDDIAVARPVLSLSERLDDNDLLVNARTKSQQHLLAISERKSLSEVVTGVLVTRGDRHVAHSVARNAGARFSDALRIQIQANILTDPQQQHRALRERTIDFFVGRLPQPIEKDLEFETLFQEGLVVVAGAHNRWARHRKIRLAELVAEPWLLPPFETSAVGSLIAQAFRASGLEVPKNRIMTDAVLFMQSLVANGDFLSCYSSSPMRLGTVGLGLKVLPVHLPVPRSPFGILRLKNRTLSPAAELFIQHAREVAKPLAKGK